MRGSETFVSWGATRGRLLGNDKATGLSQLPRSLEVGGKLKVQLGNAQVVVLDKVAQVRHGRAYHAICQVKYNGKLVDGGWTCQNRINTAFKPLGHLLWLS